MFVVSFPVKSKREINARYAVGLLEQGRVILTFKNSIYYYCMGPDSRTLGYFSFCSTIADLQHADAQLELVWGRRVVGGKEDELREFYHDGYGDGPRS